jgi:hypothetical protein
MISEQNLMFSRLVENAVEYYQNMLLLIILKGIFFPSKLRALVCVNNVSTNVWFLQQYLYPKWQLYSPIVQQLPFTFVTNISYSFHISLNAPPATHLSRHIISNVLDQSFHISVLFYNHHLAMCCLSCHALINNLYMYWIINCQTTPISKGHNRCHVNCQHAMWTQIPKHRRTEVISNWRLKITYNFATF